MRVVILYSVEYGKETCALAFPYGNILNRTYHRLDGPAIEYTNARFYYIDGIRIMTRTQFESIVSEALNQPLALRLTDPRWWVRKYSDGFGNCSID